MLEITLYQGYFTVKNGGRSYDVYPQDVRLPMARYSWSLDRYEALSLPNIEDAYNIGRRRGYTDDDLIDMLIKLYLPVYYFKVGDYLNVDLVIGMVGHRGAGKSVGASMVCLFDFMLRGLTCWSNLPITCKVSYKDISRIYHSEDISIDNLYDLKAGYKGGVILADECNLQFASAYKTMSGANQDFGAIVQQIRKRKLSLVWTAQSFNSIDKNLRFQTDLCVACRDTHLSGDNPIMGDVAAWQVYDIGSITGKYDMEYNLSHPWITQYPVGDEVNVWMRPFWGLIDTGLLQSNDYISKYRDAKRNKLNVNADAPVNPMADPIMYIEKIKQQLRDSGSKAIWADTLWQAQGIADNKAAQTMWGSYMLANGFVRKRNKKYFYELQ